MASKKREDKGGWEKQNSKQKKQTVTSGYLCPPLSLEHVACEYYSKIPRPRPLLLLHIVWRKFFVHS